MKKKMTNKERRERKSSTLREQWQVLRREHNIKHRLYIGYFSSVCGGFSGIYLDFRRNKIVCDEE